MTTRKYSSPEALKQALEQRLRASAIIAVKTRPRAFHQCGPFPVHVVDTRPCTPQYRTMIPLDTTPEAFAIQLSIWRRMGPSGRHALVARMSEDLRELSRSGIRQRHPRWSESKVELELRRLMWGDTLFHQVYPDYAAPAP